MAASLRLFYPRSPCGERQMKLNRTASRITFLSTLSLRRATMIHPLLCNAKSIFYPRSPCGERRFLLRLFSDLVLFYPRSPCGERHYLIPRIGTLRNVFYPRSPCGERPDTLTDDVSTGGFSIHALLAESDH